MIHSSSLRNVVDKTEAEDAVVVVDNVHKTYLLGVEGVPALRGVSLKVRRGEFVVILGKSGGGKTSLLNIIGTIDKPTKGHIKVCGTLMSSKTKDEEVAYLRLKKIGFCFQTFNLISSMTALENVELPMVLSGALQRKEIREKSRELLRRVGMEERCGHLPSQLSGGEQQRVTLARAVSNNPDLVLLDEPTGDLDSKNGRIILDMLLHLNMNSRITMVMVTHDIALKFLAHRVIHMLDGKIHRIEHISPEDRENAIRTIREEKAADEALVTAQSGDDNELETEVRGEQHYAFQRYKVKYEQEKLEKLEKERLEREELDRKLGKTLSGGEQKTSLPFFSSYNPYKDESRTDTVHTVGGGSSLPSSQENSPRNSMSDTNDTMSSSRGVGLSGSVTGSPTVSSKKGRLSFMRRKERS